MAREPPHNGFPAESLFELSGTLPSYPLLYAAGAVVGWHANLLLRGLPYSSRQHWAWDHHLSLLPAMSATIKAASSPTPPKTPDPDVCSQGKPTKYSPGNPVTPRF